MAWKNVQSELPDDALAVLVYDPAWDDPAWDDPVWVGYVDGDVWRSAEGEIIAPTHWMPFPDPPFPSIRHSTVGANAGGPRP